MKKSLAYLCVMLFSIGCGGSGGSDTNALAGEYQGSWSSTSASGSSTLAISTKGTITGNLHNDGTGTDSPISGTVSDSSVIIGYGPYTIVAPRDASGNTLNIVGNQSDGLAIQFQMHLTRQ